MASRARAVDAAVGVDAAVVAVAAAAATTAVSGRRSGARMSRRHRTTGRPPRTSVILSTARRQSGNIIRKSRLSGSASRANRHAMRTASRGGKRRQKVTAIPRPVRDDGAEGAAAAAGGAAAVIAKAMSASARRRTARSANHPALKLTWTTSRCPPAMACGPPPGRSTPAVPTHPATRVATLPAPRKQATVTPVNPEAGAAAGAGVVKGVAANVARRLRPTVAVRAPRLVVPATVPGNAADAADAEAMNAVPPRPSTAAVATNSPL
jgi:hypothetical protein